MNGVKKMKITKDHIEYIAHLGRLELQPDEIDEYTAQLNNILQYMEMLSRLDTENIEPTSHSVHVPCFMREDREKESFPVEDSLMNAPARKGSSFQVPPVIEVD